MPSLREAIAGLRTGARQALQPVGKAAAMTLQGVSGVIQVAAGRGLPKDHPVVLARLAICAVCPSLTGGRCGKLLAALKPGARTCGCFVRLKARLPTAHCPDVPQRWTAFDPFQG